MMSKCIHNKLRTYTCIRPTQDEGWVIKSAASNSVMLLTTCPTIKPTPTLCLGMRLKPSIVGTTRPKKPFSAQGTSTCIRLPTLLYRAQRAASALRRFQHTTLSETKR